MKLDIADAARYKVADFQKPDPIPRDGIQRVTELMLSGELFRYSNPDPKESDAYQLEQDFKRYTGQPYALAGNSCSSVMGLALEALGVRSGDKILVPAFTFTAVPSAVVKLGASPVLVECDQNYKVDIDDLARKITPETKFFLLSYMRGRISDMDAIMQLSKENGISIIEDCAHGVGGYWDGKMVGTFGVAACYSFQSYKILSAGEGGMVTTTNEEAFVRMLYLHGAYEENYRKHFVESPFFEALANEVALDNFRMTNAMAAMVRPQLPLIKDKARLYRKNYNYLIGLLEDCPFIEIPEDDPREDRVLDSIQFRMPGFSPEQMRTFVALVKERGIPLSGFGADKNNARAPWNWKFLPEKQYLPQTQKWLETACDLRLVSSLDDDMLSYIADAITNAARKAS
jgi:dTDP-4-amino-4,6-dideoxygalactose transaminase